MTDDIHADRATAGSGTPHAARVFVVDMILTREQMLDYYRGAVHTVVATSRDGRTISLPIASLRSYLTHGGVRGSFAVRVDSNNRLLGIERLAPGRRP